MKKTLLRAVKTGTQPRPQEHAYLCGLHDHTTVHFIPTPIRRFFSNPRWLALVVYTVVAWFSIGYHHPDEHFQILEFADWKMGITPANVMPWEFHEQMRPTLQPTVVAAVATAYHSLGLRDPFVLAFLLRWGSGLAFLWAFGRFARRVPGEGTAPYRWLWWVVALGWCVPYLAVRCSSESWAATALLLACCQLADFQQQPTPRAALWAGVWLGLSFDFRFQMAFAAVGAAAWLVWRAPRQWQSWLALTAGGLATVALGLLCDRWFYGQWTLSPWNYWHANITQGKAATFGVEPWWWYLPELVLRVVPPMSLWLVVLAAVGLRRQRGHWLVWLLLPFVLGHSLVGHKEMRFLAPMLTPLLCFAVWGWEVVRADWWQRRWVRRVARITLVINGLLLLYGSLRPAQDVVAYFRFLYHYTERHPAVLYAEKPHPYNMVGYDSHFYDAPNLTVVLVDSLGSLADTTRYPARPGDLVLSKELTLKATALPYRTERVFTNFPDWVLAWNVNDWQNRTKLWSVWRRLDD